MYAPLRDRRGEARIHRIGNLLLDFELYDAIGVLTQTIDELLSTSSSRIRMLFVS